MGFAKIRPSIRKYFFDHPNREIWFEEIKTHLISLGLSPNDQSTKHAVGELIRRGMPIEIVESGHCWVYRHEPDYTKKPVSTTNVTNVVTSPKELPKAPTKKLFQLVHTTKQGNWILEDEEGELVVVKQIDI